MGKMRIDRAEVRNADIFEILLDSFPDMIHSVDDSGYIVYANRAAEALLGYSQDELLGMGVHGIYADEILEQMDKGFRDLKRTGYKVVESVLKTKEGVRIPVEIRSFSIYDERGDFLRTFSIFRDLREIKRLQQGLIHQSRLAAIGELASGVAHDINNPLTVISISNEMLTREAEVCGAEGTELAGRVDDLAAGIHRGVEAIEKLVHHLRDYSRGIVEEHEPLDLAVAIEDALFLAATRVRDNNVEVQTDLMAGKYVIKGCANQVEQVFMNLVTNACDAMEEAEQKVLSIAIVATERNGQAFWQCDVTDTGCGMDPGITNTIFKSFFTTKERGKGTGLGLSIVNGIVRDHNGFITVESQPGVGSTFSVLFPRLPGSATP